jgi:REP-associated tyrosine transposase
MPWRRWPTAGPGKNEKTGEHHHVRLLVRYPPKLPVSTLVNRLKGVSAHYLREEFTGRVNRHLVHGHLWSPSDLAASSGEAPLAIEAARLDQRDSSRP